MDKKELKVALVHDFLIEFGGAERVLCVLAEMFPEAPIYTIICDKEKFPAWLRGKKIRTSFLQKFPKFLRKRKKWLLPFLAVAPETFDLREFDLVISSSGAWSKGIITRLNTTHIAYLHSPMRFVWDENGEYLLSQKKGGVINFFTRGILSYIRLWDFSAADRPEHLIANSEYTKTRIKKYYNRDSSVIYPPVSIGTTDEIKNSDKKYFLVVSRLSAYKKVDVIIRAFNQLKLPLIVVGTGDEERRLKAIAGENVKFLGFQADEKLPEIYADARAFIFAALDDFGMTSVEAMAQGVPVLGIRKGGTQEVIREGETGEFFDLATPELIADCVRRFCEKENKFDQRVIKARAREFSTERFKKELSEFIENKIG